MSTDEEKLKKLREAGEREAARLWRAWRTVHEMVQDRGYELSEEEVKISLEDFIDKFRDDGEGGIEYVPFQSSSMRPQLTASTQPQTHEVLRPSIRCHDAQVLQSSHGSRSKSRQPRHWHDLGRILARLQRGHQADARLRAISFR